MNASRSPLLIAAAAVLLGGALAALYHGPWVVEEPARVVVWECPTEWVGGIPVAGGRRENVVHVYGEPEPTPPQCRDTHRVDEWVDFERSAPHFIGPTMEDGLIVVLGATGAYAAIAGLIVLTRALQRGAG